ncbi:MAG: 4Fe-4S binding protein [Planctomycetota bacterium]
MKLNIFLPFLRREKGQPAPKPSALRKLLKRMGPVWHAAPLRRAIQTTMFLLFLWLFFHVAWPYGGPHDQFGAYRASKEHVHVKEEFFLAIDPLLSISTFLAAKAWVWSLVWAGGILIACVLFPRGFCGYLCPLGTLIDFFDWAVGKRVKRFRVKRDGWWVNLKYYILAGVLVSSVCGVLLSGFVAAIPVITRGFEYIATPFCVAYQKGWHDVPPVTWGQGLSIALFLGVLGLGFLRPRFWCKYVCPSGAVFSSFNLFRVGERKVESSCIHCNRCIEICPFDAIKADYTTRTSECTLCQSCGGVCPTHAIKFVDRWNVWDLKKVNDPPVHEQALSRRGFLTASLAATATAFAFGDHTLPALLGHKPIAPLRPPGSVPEPQFLNQCIRCGECFQVCPNNVLQPMRLKDGFRNWWTPQMSPDWAGCEPSCNNCGQACPTGAIRALPLEEKKVAKIGLAWVNQQTCLPWAGKSDCDLCHTACAEAGYNAIEYLAINPQLDENGYPIDGTGNQGVTVRPDLCVGCGLCQERCNAINVTADHKLKQSAIVVTTQNQDRLASGSYLARRKAEAAQAAAQSRYQFTMPGDAGAGPG